MSETFKCERRRENGVYESNGPFKLPLDDHWRPDGTCSYCGSMKPEALFAAITEGKEITPTDKNYKIYVAGIKKFYFQHLSGEEQKAFYKLYKDGKLKMEYPGHFYNPPFFFSKLSTEGVTSDPNDPAIKRGVPDTEPVKQHEKYLVLSEEERAKGFVRPVRHAYLHATELGGCGTCTTMNQALAETYARDPYFYGSTYCAGCKKHRLVGPEGEFIWKDTTEKVGT